MEIGGSWLLFVTKKNHMTTQFVLALSIVDNISTDKDDGKCARKHTLYFPQDGIGGSDWLFQRKNNHLRFSQTMHALFFLTVYT